MTSLLIVVLSQVVFISTRCSTSSVGCFLIVINQSDYISVVSSANLTIVLVGCIGVQSLVKRVLMGLNTQPCDVPVFRIRVQEVRCPISTFWGLSDEVFDPGTQWISQTRFAELARQFVWNNCIKYLTKVKKNKKSSHVFGFSR